MPFLSGTNAVQLTPADWVEIAMALESKIAAIERGFYDDGHEWPGLASNDAWVLHLVEILHKIGPDGSLAVEDGVLPGPEGDAS